MKEVGMYIHIPFCKKKCYYCDFLSYGNKETMIDEYIKWLNYEIKEVGESIKLDYENKMNDMVKITTIYIGGGTPSYIDSKYIIDIIKNIKENYLLVENIEITLEINPGTADEKKLEEYKNARNK